jgi:hypothetical protein
VVGWLGLSEAECARAVQHGRSSRRLGRWRDWRRKTTCGWGPHDGERGRGCEAPLGRLDPGGLVGRID